VGGRCRYIEKVHDVLQIRKKEAKIIIIIIIIIIITPKLIVSRGFPPRTEHAVAQWLRHYATIRKVAGSIPDEAIFKNLSLLSL
jgi:hypothetical protein